MLWEGKFWGGSDQRIISYGEFTHTNRSGKNVSWFVVGLAAQKNYLTVFVTAVEDGAYLAESSHQHQLQTSLGRGRRSSRRTRFPGARSDPSAWVRNIPSDTAPIPIHSLTPGDSSRKIHARIAI